MQQEPKNIQTQNRQDANLLMRNKIDSFIVLELEIGNKVCLQPGIWEVAREGQGCLDRIAARSHFKPSFFRRFESPSSSEGRWL